MRPLRLLLSLATCLSAILVLSYFAASRTGTSSATQGSNSLGTYFNWQSSSLFPPSAIISLTDDNSTFFLARPANFGPLLPAHGLNGQLWIGSGFGDDMGRVVSRAEGELGCSDVPGWGDGDYGSVSGGASDAAGKSKVSLSGSKTAEAKVGKVKRSKTDRESTSDDHTTQVDGTDDHLHHPLPASGNLKNSPEVANLGKKLAHADIQSLQETAEIAGKVVLLTRGGCGFLEKVKWVQRRGGVGLIVGDNVRGGALVTMYARGDTSNVTIPALFTSHMTAHLLSSLVPAGRLLEDIDPEEAARLGLVLGDKPAAGSSAKPDTKQPSTVKYQLPSSKLASNKLDGEDGDVDAKFDRTSSQEGAEDTAKQGWLKSLLGGSPKGTHQDTRRPPSSGKIDWIQQQNFEDDESIETTTRMRKSSPKYAAQQTPSSKSGAKNSGDGFVIGVQDWRDPDLLDAQLAVAQDSSTQHVDDGEGRPTAHDGLKGGSITPGSGEYDNAKKRPTEGKSSPKGSNNEATKANDDEQQDSWLERLGLSSKNTERPAQKNDAKAPHEVTQIDRKPVFKNEKSVEDDEDEGREGLWVTLTPTSMSSSPFFDTLLVLVISPLVTLTIVYALLLLRSRIRRRRWRAPKSVVDRLPVRTYHTISSSTNSSSSNSPPRSPAEPTSATPLLHSSARSISQGSSRPRSRTASEVPATGSSFRGTNNSSLDAAQEKREAGLAEWRRRYVGRQKECVVCLEEYIDGISQVMSLPCGHEFHAACISPWLTTRRRTCPICKSDVVRSIGRTTASPSTQPLAEDSRYHDADEEEEIMDTADNVQEQVVGTRNDDPASAEPVSREDEAFEDLERGLEDRSR